MQIVVRALTILGVVGCLGHAAAGDAPQATRSKDGRTMVAGGHFRLTVDSRRGGELTDIRLFDGSQWSRVLGADAQTCPAVVLADAAGEYLLSNDAGAQIGAIEQTPEVIRFESCGVPKTADGRSCPWTVKLRYEVHAEGAVFVDVHYTLPEGKTTLTGASLSFHVDRALVKAAHYSGEKQMGREYPGFPTARVAFGVNPNKSYTNELEAVVEYRTPLCEKADRKVVERSYGKTWKYAERTPLGVDARLDQAGGRFQWILAAQPFELRGPFHYRNRFSLALAAGVAGTAHSTMVGQRIYNWVNFLDKKNWYPTDEQIDTMAANGATTLILHKFWMRVPGSNGIPPADYRASSDEEFFRVSKRCHAKGMRLGLYMRGCEMYGLECFKKYGTRDRDGIFMDWHGLLSVGRHEQMFKPDPPDKDSHFSEDGNYLPAREYFLFMKRCRQVVGRKGFLIGHQGKANSGVLSNLVFDAYSPGESHKDWNMFSGDVHVPTYVGMCGGGVCSPWPIAGPYRTPEGVAKMAAWGFYPHVILAYETYSYKADVQVLAADPDAPSNRWVLPYWRLLRAINMNEAAVHNLPSVNVVAATCSRPEFQCLVYKQQDAKTYLVIVANLGKTQGQAEIALVGPVLGLQGRYEVSHVDAATGRITPRGDCTTTLTTSELPTWGIEGFRLHQTGTTSGKGVNP